MTSETITTLSRMQREALTWYLRGETITEAARRAGYAHPEKSGPRLRKNPKFQAAVDEYFYDQEMSANEVVARLSQQARADYSRYYRKSGLVDLSQILKDGNSHLIAGIGYAASGQMVVNFYNAQSALVHIGRYHGIFSDRIKVDSWMDEVIDLLRRGEILAEDVRAELPDDADRLIAAALVSHD